MGAVTIRVASPDDAPALLGIYAPYVEETAITFEYEVPTEAEFRRRIEATGARYPYLVAEQDGTILGYAYLSAFVGRAAYDWAAETSIYLRQDRRHDGLGRRLYETLERCARAQGIWTLYACIGYPAAEDAHLTRNSAEFHEHLGYALVGRCHRCGYKFATWYDMIWMEKPLGTPPAVPAPIVPFPALPPEQVRALLMG